MKRAMIFLCAAALTSTAAFADDSKPKKGVDARFEMLDKDADGRLSKEELANDNSLSGMFGTLDGDSDGFVTKDEFRAKVKTKPVSSG